MNPKLVFFLAAIGWSFPAFAGSHQTSASSSSSDIQRILQGDAKPDDQAQSRTDPNVKFRVLATGTVEKTNARFGTTTYINPAPAKRVNTRNRRW